MNQLPSFSGDVPTCSKCGHLGASTRYLEFGECYHPDVMTFGARNERLHRCCDRCRYQWDEAVNDRPAWRPV